MALKVVATKPDNPVPVPRAHVAEGEDHVQPLFHVHGVALMYAKAHRLMPT